MGSHALLQDIFSTQGSNQVSHTVGTPIAELQGEPQKSPYEAWKGELHQFQVWTTPFSSTVVQPLSQIWLCDPLDWSHARTPCPSPTPGACSNTCPSSRWCHPTISSSFIPFSSFLQSFPALGSFPMSQVFTSGGQSIGVSAAVLPLNIQNWFPLGWVGWISLQSKGLSRVFSNTTVQKHQFFSAQLSSSFFFFLFVCLFSHFFPLPIFLIENKFCLSRLLWLLFFPFFFVF